MEFEQSLPPPNPDQSTDLNQPKKPSFAPEKKDYLFDKFELDSTLSPATDVHIFKAHSTTSNSLDSIIKSLSSQLFDATDHSFVRHLENNGLNYKSWEELQINSVEYLGIDSSSPSKILHNIEKVLNPATQLHLRNLFYEGIYRYLGHEMGLGNDPRSKFHFEAGSYVCMPARLYYLTKKLIKETDSVLSQEDTEKILKSLKSASEYSIGVKNPNIDRASIAFNEYQNGNPVTICTGWFKHAIEVTIHNGYLFYINRGEKSDGNSAIEVYKISDTEKIDRNFFEKLTGQGQDFKEENKQGRINWFEKEMKSELRLNPIYSIKKSAQKTGNCSWANHKGGLHAEIFLIKLLENLKNGHSESKACELADAEAYTLFKKWEEVTRGIGLEEFYQLTDIELNKPSPILTSADLDGIRTILEEKTTDKRDKKSIAIQNEQTMRYFEGNNRVAHTNAEFIQGNVSKLKKIGDYIIQEVSPNNFKLSVSGGDLRFLKANLNNPLSKQIVEILEEVNNAEWNFDKFNLDPELQELAQKHLKKLP